MIHVISLGAGVQSSTMALMAARGEITPMPDCAVFADTRAEPQEVYEWLLWLERQLPFPVYRVSKGSLTERVLGTDGYKNGQHQAVDIPAHILRGGEKQGFITRHCTQDFKIIPVRRRLRELCGIVRKRSPKVPIVSLWMGISTDEADRMKPYREPWVETRFPLIEAGMSRDACRASLVRNYGRVAPKSACVYCPYHSDAGWRSLSKDEMHMAILVDERIRNARPKNGDQLFLHKSCVPLRDVDLRSAEDAGQLSMFGNECEGMCRV